MSVDYLLIKCPGMAYWGPLLSVSQGCNLSVCQAVFSFGGSTKEESPSNLTQVIGNIHFLAAVRLRALASHQLLVWYPQTLDATCSSLPHGFFHREFIPWLLASSMLAGKSFSSLLKQNLWQEWHDIKFTYSICQLLFRTLCTLKGRDSSSNQGMEILEPSWNSAYHTNQSTLRILQETVKQRARNMDFTLKPSVPFLFRPCRQQLLYQMAKERKALWPSESRDTHKGHIYLCIQQNLQDIG